MGMQRINGGHAESSAEGTARRPPSYWYPASRISRINVNALGPAFVPEEFLNERSTLELEHAPGDGEAVIESRLFERDRKNTRLNSSHTVISYAVFCLKKKNQKKKNIKKNKKKKHTKTTIKEYTKN